MTEGEPLNRMKNSDLKGKSWQIWWREKFKINFYIWIFLMAELVHMS